MGAKELKEKLFYTNKNGLKGIDEALYNACVEYCECYKKFLDKAKTEREAVETALVGDAMVALKPKLEEIYK